MLTGGTGFVGLNIAERLLKEGWNVVLYARKPLDRRITEELQALPGTLSLELGDVLDQNRMEELLSRYEIRDMIHGAAVTPDEKTEAANPAMIMEVNCMGLLHSLLAAKIMESAASSTWALFPPMEGLRFWASRWRKGSARGILTLSTSCQSLPGRGC